MKISPRAALMRAIDIAGGQTQLARKIEKRQQNVHSWLKRGRVPAEMAGPVSEAVGYEVTRADLRPDLFGPGTVMPGRSRKGQRMPGRRP